MSNLNDDQIKSVIKRYDELKSNRYNWEEHWEELSKFVVPRRSGFTFASINGEKKGKGAFTGRPEYFATVLASTFDGLLTNPSQPWFQLRIRDFDAAPNIEIKRWLEAIASVVFKTLVNSNFYTELPEIYLDQAVFGTSLLYMEEDDDDLVRFAARNLADCYITENNKGDVDTVFRCSHMSARNLVLEFGRENVHEDVVSALENSPDRTYEVLHVTFPRSDVQFGKKDNKNLPYASVWILTKHRFVLRESGYNEFPWAVPRFRKINREVYGRSPAMTVLRDIKSLNAAERLTLEAIALEVRPVMAMQFDQLQPKNTLEWKPGGTFMVRRIEELPRPLNTGSNSRVGMFEIERKEKQIADAFFFDIILTQDGGTPRTATEIIQRTDERSRLLISYLNRLQRELLEPIIERVIGILHRANKLPEPPESALELLEQAKNRFDLVFTSPLANAQAAHKANGIVRWVELMQVPMSQGIPVYDRLDWDKAIMVLAQAFNVPNEVLRSDAEVADLRQARAEQEQQMKALAGAQQMADVANTVADAERKTTDTDGPVNQLLSALGA